MAVSACISESNRLSPRRKGRSPAQEDVASVRDLLLAHASQGFKKDELQQSTTNPYKFLLKNKTYRQYDHAQ
jgi:hypothetical protein